MLTKMTEEDWVLVLEVFDACRSRRGDKGRDDRKFLEALHYFTVHNITWPALPAEFGSWNSIWKRFWRLSRAVAPEATCYRTRSSVGACRNAREAYDIS
jgi:transposase